jgi:hypothetical protein
MNPATAANTRMRPGGHCPPMMQTTPTARAMRASAKDARARRMETSGWIGFVFVFIVFCGCWLSVDAVSRLTKKLTDRRRKRALAANPASEQRETSELTTRGGGSVRRLVRPCQTQVHYNLGKGLMRRSSEGYNAKSMSGCNGSSVLLLVDLSTRSPMHRKQMLHRQTA